MLKKHVFQRYYMFLNLFIKKMFHIYNTQRNQIKLKIVPNLP